MKSIRDIYKIGKGPSSSHTMGPFKAVRNFLENHPDSGHLRVILYGSLAATGKGHLTDTAIEEAFLTWKRTDRETLESTEKREGYVEIEWRPKENLPVHPNGMKIGVLHCDGSVTDEWTYYSIGGGDIICIENPIEGKQEEHIYGLTTLKEIMDWCNRTGKAYWEYVQEHEEQSTWDHLKLVWEVMRKAVERGIVIVNISQCPTGMVEMERYETGLHLLDAGVISGYDSTVESILTKLMFILGHGKTTEEIRHLMNIPLAGEITKE